MSDENKNGRLKVATTFVLLLTGCASSSANTKGTSLVQGMTAPNPSGCYVKVFDQPQLRGTADFINGPMRYSRLDGLPNGANWSNHIRSVEVGPGATATAWSEVNFAGVSMELRLDTRYATLPTPLTETIESLDVKCTQSPGSTP